MKLKDLRARREAAISIRSVFCFARSGIRVNMSVNPRPGRDAFALNAAARHCATRNHLLALPPMDMRSFSERDICTKFVTPALRRAGWDEMLQIREEVSFTKGRIVNRHATLTPFRRPIMTPLGAHG